MPMTRRAPTGCPPTAGSRRWTAPGGLWRVGQGSDYDLVVHPVGRPKRPRAFFSTNRGRRFTPPWSVEETQACFIVKDFGG